MPRGERSSWRWLWRSLIVIGLLMVAIVAWESIASDETRFNSRWQLDVATGRTRVVETRFGSASEGLPQDTFISRQLAGEAVGGDPDWRLLSYRGGGGLKVTLGSAPTGSLWHRCGELEDWWDRGGFTIEARTVSARAVLHLLRHKKTDELWNYLNQIQQRVDALGGLPASERRTDVEDLPTLDVLSD